VSTHAAAPRARPPAVASDGKRGAVLVFGILATIGATAGVLILFSSTSEATGALVLGVLLFVVSLPVLARAARSQGDRTLFWLLTAALGLKLLGGFANYLVAYEVYGGVADAQYYHDAGRTLAPSILAGNVPDLDPIVGTNFIKLFTGWIYSLVGPNPLSGFLVYSWLAFWGMLCFYKAFVIAVPEGRRRTYFFVLFFLPSMLFWPSAIGKEAWMVFALGIASYGAARTMAGRSYRGLAVSIGGLWLASLVRPHVAGLLAISLALGYLFRRSRSDLGILAPIAKGVTLAALIVVAAVFTQRTEQFFQESNYQTGQGITSLLQQTTEKNAYGGSAFVPSIFESPARAPIAIGTVLFRPLIFDAHNLQAFASGMEGTFLLLLFFFRISWVLSALRSIRRQPYLAIAIVYTALFVVAFSAFANFGLLARERVMVLPFLLTLVSVPSPTAKASQESAEHQRPPVSSPNLST
jgi:hypothetical protein